jgi:para-nitrobenzyl esterase
MDHTRGLTSTSPWPRRRVRLAVAGVALLVAGIGLSTTSDVSAAGAGSSAVVSTDRGPVRGSVVGGVRVFQGIPYARPPVGALRWQPPLPARPWSDPRDATRPGPMCAQSAIDGGVDATSSEDCLYLNVTTPAGGGHRRPVIVYLHGGGFATGAGSDFDARRLAATGDAVVVTVNYRLGIFGFFGFPGLRDSGTYGLADQQAAMRWVRANATAFGGDPRTVTLMGESSGGATVCAHLVSPAAAGLFHRAIIQSGSCLQNWPREMMVPDSEAISYWAPRGEVQERGTAAADGLGCRGDAALRCLRAAPVAELLAHTGQFSVPAFDTPLLPVDPVAALRTGAVNRVPVLQGNTRDEHRFFAVLFGQSIDAAGYHELLTRTFGPTVAERVARRYPYRPDLAGDWSGTLTWAAVGTDRAWVCPTVTADRLLARRVPVYSFEFADRAAPDYLDFFPDDYPAGAYHGSELAYLFDIGDSYRLLDPAQRELANRMIRYWTAFARTGDPNTAGLTRWPGFPATQELTPTGTTTVDLADRHQCAFWATVA